MLKKDLIQVFQKVEDDYNLALETNDVNEIDGFPSDDWTLLEPQFGLISKTNLLKAIKNGDLIHKSMKKQVIDVKLYDNMAIVIPRGINFGILRNEEFNSEQWKHNVYAIAGSHVTL